MSLPKLYEQIGIEPPRVLDYYGVSTENLPTELPKGASLEGKTEYHYRWNLETGTRPGDALALCFICNTLLEEEVPNTNRMLDLLVSTGIEFRTRNLRGRYKSTNFIEEVWDAPRTSIWRNILLNSTTHPECKICQIKSHCRTCPIYNLNLCRV